MPLPTLAAILGHANLRSVMKYVHIGQADMDVAMEQFGGGGQFINPSKTEDRLVQ